MSRVKIEDLKVGDVVYAYMRKGFAVKTVRRPDGSSYGQVPDRRGNKRTYDLSRFQGRVQANNTENQVLTISVHLTNSLMQSQGARSPYPLSTDFHYSNFGKLLLLSDINYDPHDYNLTFPANFVDAAFKPYRTFTRVIIPSFVQGV